MEQLLTSFEQDWLASAKLQQYAKAIRDRGAPLDNCFGFVDGTIQRVCRPGQNQRALYNGHKRVHAIKFQAVSAPNGLCINLFGPVEGRRHDSGMLADYGLLTLLERFAVTPDGKQLCIYGDPAYPHCPQLQAPFKGAMLSQEEMDWNKAISQVRIQVEWMFGGITNYFKFLDFKKSTKVQLSAVGNIYIVCTLLQMQGHVFMGLCQQITLENYLQLWESTFSRFTLSHLELFG